jgi:D-alanyl-D-alanine carboxypeptidase
VSTSDAGVKGGGKVRAVVIDDLRAMAEAAAAAGNAIAVQSAYRSYSSQEDVFQSWVKRYGYDRALEVSARPGHSEHQLGLTIDFRSEPGGSPFEGMWATTPAGKWMNAHAWEYGWVMSYPKGSMALTCYDYEPWHYRYVGRDLAALIHDSGLTPREYLWANFTTTVVPPAPPPTKAPTKTPKPTATATPTATVEPSTSPSLSPGPTIAATDTPAPTASPLSPTAAPTSPATAPPDVGPTSAFAGAAAAGMAVLLGLVGVGAWFARRRVRPTY